MFIEALRTTCNVTASARHAGVTRAGAYKARSTSAAFRGQWDDAIAEGIDVLRAAAWERATSGQSDYLLWKLLQAHDPETYGHPGNRIEHTGPDGGPIQHATVVADITEVMSDPENREAALLLSRTMESLAIGDGSPPVEG